jgi:hypothetical protein
MNYRTTITVADAHATPEEVADILDALVQLAPDAGAAAGQNIATGEASFVLVILARDARRAVDAAAGLVLEAIRGHTPAAYDGHIAGVTAEPVDVPAAA